jgi:hypothetical protein
MDIFNRDFIYKFKEKVESLQFENLHILYDLKLSSNS